MAILLAAILSISGILVAELVSGQVQQPVPEFTLRYADKSYDVPSTTTSSTDPYTGNITTSTFPGYHVPYKTIEVTITNNIGATYYSLRYKGHYSNTWTYYPYSGVDDHYISDSAFPPAFTASNSSYTVGDLYLGLLPQPIPDGAPIDVQVQAMFGNFDVTPYSHAIDLGFQTYDAAFEGTAGEWSNTQTITLPATQTSVSSTPTTPEISVIAILLLLIVLPFIVVGIRKKDKN